MSLLRTRLLFSSCMKSCVSKSLLQRSSAHPRLVFPLHGSSLAGMKVSNLMKSLAVLDHNVPSIVGQIRNYGVSAEWAEHPGGEYIEVLTDKTIESFLKANESVLVMFYAPWCRHCKNSKPEFARAASIMQTEVPSGKLAVIDCTLYPAIYEKYGVAGYPTIKYYRFGKLIGEYHHKRQAMDFVFFMKRSPTSKGDL